VLVGQLALDNKVSYSATAETLLKKWHDKNLLPKTTNTSKVKTITNKPIVEKKLAIKRKSDDDDMTHSTTLRFILRVNQIRFISFLILLVNLNHLMNLKMVIEINHHHRLKNVKFFLLLNMLAIKNRHHLHHQRLI
jgi:hypothetical protein